METDYIIDFDRINELTQHPNDKGRTDDTYASITFNITKSILKSYMETYINRYSRHADNTKLVEIIETLRYNKILISKSDIRDRKINNILDDE